MDWCAKSGIYVLEIARACMDVTKAEYDEPEKQQNNPLHGIKLADIVSELVGKYGWEELGKKVNINSFNNNPSIKSSLKFLRKTPWAREKVEQLYVKSIKS